MKNLSIIGNGRDGYRSGHAIIKLWALLFCFGMAASAQSAPPENAPLSIPATHVLGLEHTKANCNGTLSIQDNALQFQRAGETGADVNIASIQGVFLGGESKQVGGVPMTLAKAAVPFGGGRVVSLLAHKNYDTVTVEYVDTDGGVHGAIFQVEKGQGELVKNELLARGVPASSGGDQFKKQSSAEVTNENR